MTYVICLSKDEQERLSKLVPATPRGAGGQAGPSTWKDSIQGLGASGKGKKGIFPASLGDGASGEDVPLLASDNILEERKAEKWLGVSKGGKKALNQVAPLSPSQQSAPDVKNIAVTLLKSGEEILTLQQ